MTSDTDKPKLQTSKRTKPSTDDLLGATVIYTPTAAQAASLRSIRGINCARFAALVTLVHDDGQCALHVFRPLNMGSFDVSYCQEGEGPNTFTRR